MTSNNDQRLKELTEKLLMLNLEAKDHFVKVKSQQINSDFYKEVKPFANNVKELSDEWKDLVINWIGRTAPKYIYPINVLDTHENLNTVSVQCFFHSTSQKRFNKLLESNIFILESVYEQLKNK